MAYILGFFSADGYITLNKRGAHFWCISITDGNLLRSIRKCIDSNHTISFKKGFANHKDSYRLQIGSKEICNDLRNLGFTENKTKNMQLPNIPKKYFSDFSRGYFDGDGNVWVGKIHKERKNQTLAIRTDFTSCSKIFLESFNGILCSLLKIKGVVRKGNGNYYRLSFSINGSLKLYDFMYNRLVSSDNSLLLKRKRFVFEKFIKMRS